MSDIDNPVKFYPNRSWLKGMIEGKPPEAAQPLSNLDYESMKTIPQKPKTLIEEAQQLEAADLRRPLLKAALKSQRRIKKWKDKIYNEEYKLEKMEKYGEVEKEKVESFVFDDVGSFLFTISGLCFLLFFILCLTHPIRTGGYIVTGLLGIYPLVHIYYRWIKNWLNNL